MAESLLLKYLLVCVSSGLASAITLLSGFGLGTLLLPVFLVFFPIPIAIPLTALVHLLNNAFKLILLGKYTDKTVVLHFGLPARLSAFVGAEVFLWLSSFDASWEYQLLGHTFSVKPIKLVVALLMIVFALWEVVPSLQKVTFSKQYLPIGGILSGFFGGLTGHQGVFRSAFLLRTGLTKESFIGTGVVIACLVDISRLSVYATSITSVGNADHVPILIAATLSAFLGALAGNRMMKKVTIRSIQILVSVMMFGIAVSLAVGLL
jgi:uncharacterized membrane protein YfcA